ncbi:MAG: hypothetical protein EPO47_11180 [Rugosibacter sp.]|nr:MAG: hypothetical protein EPO60_04970 [Rugosibacter sp.]TBR07499.1 MAG: hypothetical protein EPO47_11180 [Rugosibacter sp.]
MKIIHTLFAFAVLSLSTQHARSADTEGHFWLGGGTGGVMCPQFVASMEKARSLGIDSVGYATETQGYLMYLLGFQTGYNMSTKDTCDIFPSEEKAYSLLSWAENYCRENASSRFADGVVALSKNRHPKRLRVCSK